MPSKAQIILCMPGLHLILTPVTSLVKIYLQGYFWNSGLKKIAIKWLFYQISLESATKWLIRWSILYKRGEGWMFGACTVRGRTTRCTLHTAHDKLHTAHCTLHIAYCTLHTAHCTLHTAYCILHRAGALHYTQGLWGHEDHGSLPRPRKSLIRNARRPTSSI